MHLINIVRWLNKYLLCIAETDFSSISGHHSLTSLQLNLEKGLFQLSVLDIVNNCI